MDEDGSNPRYITSLPHLHMPFYFLRETVFLQNLSRPTVHSYADNTDSLNQISEHVL